MSEDGAPASLEELREVLASVTGGEGDARLGRRTVEVFSGMIAAPRQAAVYSITELGEAFGVHPSTLTRLAKALGFRGFSDFQAVFRRHVARTGHFYSDQVSQLRAISASEHRALDVFSRIAHDERANIDGMLNNLEAEAVERAVRALVAAGRVRALGMRQSYALASFFAYALGMLRDDVTVLSPEYGPAHGLASLCAGDLLVVIGFAPYTRTTVSAAALARERGVPVLAITDSDASPLATEASHTFVTPAGGHFFSNSVGGATVLVEALLALVAREMGDDAQAALAERERLISDLDVAL